MFKNITITLLLLLINVCSFAQDDHMRYVQQNISNGKMENIATYIKDAIELDIIGVDNIYGKTQATLILKDFGKKYLVKTFVVVHKGEQRNGKYVYLVGTYTSKGGDKFRFFVYSTHDEGKQPYIHQIKIDKLDK